MPKWLLLEEAAVLKSSLFAASCAGFCSKRGFAAGRPLCEWRPQEPAEPEASPSVPGLCGFCLGLAAIRQIRPLEVTEIVKAGKRWVVGSWVGEAASGEGEMLMSQQRTRRAAADATVDKDNAPPIRTRASTKAAPAANADSSQTEAWTIKNICFYSNEVTLLLFLPQY